jgi:hypothetical protein
MARNEETSNYAKELLPSRCQLWATWLVMAEVLQCIKEGEPWLKSKSRGNGVFLQP